MVKKYLEDLENRIDPAFEDKLLANWKCFWNGTGDADIFISTRNKKISPKIQWPDISINAAIDNYELMLIHQLKMCSDILANGTGALLNIRCNYGTGILPSVFGAELFMMDDALNTLPTTKPLRGGEKEIKKILEKDIPDLNTGLGKKTFEMADKYLEWIKPYPKLRKYVSIYHPDLQGPMDVCELLYGSDIFIALIDKPDFIKQLLDLITRTYIAFMKKWQELVPFKDEYNTHWSMLHKGKIMLRDDSGMNLSPEMFEEFIRPYDQKLLSVFGGGVIHFCGKGDHFIDILSKMEKLYAINLSQPEYNDMETIFKNTVDKNIRIIGLDRATAEKAVKNGRNLRKCVHCW
jgi:hypothetical protein